MKLVIGGYSQGKLNFVLEKNKKEHCVIYDGVIPDEKELQEMAEQGNIIIINHFHSWVKERMIQGGSPEEEINQFLSKRVDSIVISDEIGNGIVPIDAFEREYRERDRKSVV